MGNSPKFRTKHSEQTPQSKGMQLRLKKKENNYIFNSITFQMEANAWSLSFSITSQFLRLYYLLLLLRQWVLALPCMCVHFCEWACVTVQLPCHERAVCCERALPCRECALPCHYCAITMRLPCHCRAMTVQVCDYRAMPMYDYVTSCALALCHHCLCKLLVTLFR